MKKISILTDGNCAVSLSKGPRGKIDHIAPLSVNWETRTITGGERSRQWWTQGFPADLLAKMDMLGIQIDGAWTHALVAQRFVGNGQFFGEEFDNSPGLKNCFVRGTGAFPVACKTATGFWEDLRDAAKVDLRKWYIGEFNVAESFEEGPRHGGFFWMSTNVEVHEEAVAEETLPVPA